MELTDQIALVTGAARRVGRAIALELAAAGCDLAVHYHRSDDDARDLAEEIQRLGRRVKLLKGDLNESDTPDKIVSELCKTMGAPDILVNNAAVYGPTPLSKTDQTQWDRIFRVNVTAPAMLVRAAAEQMTKSGGGRIINLTDILADRPARDCDAYCASKAALTSLTRSWALELAPTITVNAIAPGIAVFPDDCDQQTRQRLVSRVPMKRTGTPEEVALLVRLLLTTSDYITGQVFPIDGGRSIRP